MLLSDVASAEPTDKVITARIIAIVFRILNRYISNSSFSLPHIIIFVNILEISKRKNRTFKRTSLV